jgi:hypothetical protein
VAWSPLPPPQMGGLSPGKWYLYPPVRVLHGPPKVLPSTTNLSSGGSLERVIEVAHLLFPPKHTHRTRVPLISGPILQTGLSVLGRAVHKVTVRILGYVDSVEGDDVTLLKVRDDHVLELSLCLHNLQPPVTAVPQLLRFEFWPVGAAAYKLTTRFVEVSRAGP